MCDDRNCEWRLKYFAYVKCKERELRLLLSELGRANKKLLSAREELEKCKGALRH